MCSRSRPGCPPQPGPLQTREPTSPWQAGPRSHTSALARVKHELMHLELLMSSWGVLHSYIHPNFPTPRIDPSLRNPSTCSLWGKAAHILPGGWCTTWSRFSPFLTQRVCRRGGHERGPGGHHHPSSQQLGISSASHFPSSTQLQSPTSCGRGDFINYANVSWYFG